MWVGVIGIVSGVGFVGVGVGVVDVGVVEAEPAEEQVGEQVGAALLFGGRVLRADVSGGRGERGVDSGGVSCRDFGGDIAHAVGALHHRDPALGQGAAVPLGEGQRLLLHHQPQQPAAELFR
jgi:hypothetical protein